VTALVAQVAYLALSVASTVWVARSLHKNGRVFLVDTFAGNQRLADAVNALLVVGFYLVNIGGVALALRIGARPAALEAAIEYVASKLGAVLLVLGVMHLGNLAAFTAWRRRAVPSGRSA